MILLFLSFITVANCFPYIDRFESFSNNILTNILTNDIFSSEITNNGITINNINIKYEALREPNNKARKLYFNNIIKGTEYSINYIKSNIKDNNFNFDMNYEIAKNYTVFLNCMKKVSKYEDNKLYVSVNINNWDFKNKKNDLIFEFSIDKPSKIVNKTTILINNGQLDYMINFNKFSVADGLEYYIYLLKSNDKYNLYLPYFTAGTILNDTI